MPAGWVIVGVPPRHRLVDQPLPSPEGVLQNGPGHRQHQEPGKHHEPNSDLGVEWHPAGERWGWRFRGSHRCHPIAAVRTRGSSTATRMSVSSRSTSPMIPNYDHHAEHHRRVGGTHRFEERSATGPLLRVAAR